MRIAISHKGKVLTIFLKRYFPSKLYNFLQYWKVLTISLLFISWVATETHGHNWGGDFSQYIRHAMNLVDGNAYANIGYIHNTFSFVAPPIYPPVFPITLAPVYALFGFNLFAFKVLVALFFFAALYFATIMFTEKLSKAYQFSFVVLLALNPYFWELKSQILSDYLFMLIVFVTLLVLNKRYTKLAKGYRDDKNKSWGYAALIGLLFYLSYSTREIGIVFIPAILCFELFHFRKISLLTGFALLVFVALTSIEHKVIDPPAKNVERAERITILAESYNQSGTDKSHIGFIVTDLSQIKRQINRYYDAMRWQLWPRNPDSFLERRASQLALLIFLIFAVAGYFRAVYIGPGIFEIFAAGYMAILVLFGGFQGLRYVIPVIPILFLYGFKLHQDLLKTKYKPAMLVVAAVFLASAMLSYTSNNYFRNDSTLGITSPHAEDLFNYVKTATPKESIFVFTKPRVLALFTDRQASDWPKTHTYLESTDLLVKYMNAIGATYLVDSILETSGMRSAVNGPELPDDKFSLVYTNKHFYLYKLALE